MPAKVSIVGAGPAGFALAADLESCGTSALVYAHPTHLQHASHVINNGGLKANGAMKTSTNLPVTSDMGEVVRFSKIIILTVPSSGQETILQELKKFSLRQHTIIAIPGNLFSLIIESEMEVACVLETNLSPYSCRMKEGKLTVLGKKKRVCIAALPRRLGSTLNKELSIIFPVEFKWCHNVLEVCLSNINGVFHPPMMLMNAGRIESTAGGFLFYRDGLTRSIANVILAIDRVRLEIGKEFGFQLKSAIEVSNECYDQDFTDLVDLAQNSGPHNRLEAPPNLKNRNFSEDVADLLVCWHDLAEKLGIDASPINAVVTLVKIATGVDYMKVGRNLKKLDLDGLSRNELVDCFGARGGLKQHGSCLTRSV